MRLFKLFVVLFVFLIADIGPVKAQQPATTQPAPQIETIVFLRHAEKPPGGLGQISAQGLNRALALCSVLPKKFGKPDYLFAPDPSQKVVDNGPGYNYVRPLATIEPLAIQLQMPVQTPCGFREAEKLVDELDSPRYANSTIFVAWEHAFAARAAAELVQKYNGDPVDVPQWEWLDFDSLYVIKITRTPDHPTTVTFTHDHENLDNQSQKMPVPASH